MSVPFGLKIAGRQRQGLAQRDNTRMTGGGVVKDFAVSADVIVSRNCRSEDGHVVKTLLIGISNCKNGFYLKIHKSMGSRK
jgi:hypothetical protein